MTSPDDRVKIIVNGVVRLVPPRDLSYDRIIELAHGRPPWAWDTVTWYRPDQQRGGTLEEGHSVQVAPGLVINAVPTGDA